MIKTTIQRIENLNSKINRLYCDDDVILDVYSPLFSVDDKSAIIIKHSLKPISNPGYMIQGIAYKVEENMSCISCGGMFVKLPVSMKMMQKIYIDIQHNTKKVARKTVVKKNSEISDMEIDTVSSNTIMTRSYKRSR